VGLAANGDPYDLGEWRVYPAGGGRDVFGVYRARDLIQKYRPALVLLHHDVWHFARYQKILSPVQGESRIIGYIPIDGDITDQNLVQPLVNLNAVVVYTEYARAEMARAFRRLGRSTRLEVIGHGVEGFRPLAPLGSSLVSESFDRRLRAAAKRAVFPNLEDPENSFVVLNASRPADRKRVDITLEGFT